MNPTADAATQATRGSALEVLRIFLLRWPSTDTAAKVPEQASKADPIEDLILALTRAGAVSKAEQAWLRAAYARQKPTPADQRRRQSAAREAVASARIEGGEVGADLGACSTNGRPARSTRKG